MDEVEVVQVIKTTLTRRGDGVRDPIRIITQYWAMDGKLLWEEDPHMFEQRALDKHTESWIAKE